MVDAVSHTPGPWFHSMGPNADVRAGDSVSGRKIACTMFAFDNPKSATDAFEARKAEDRANAAFIARACNSHYDLLRVAELLVDWLDEEPGAHKLCDTARAAIAKATGTSS